MHLLHPGFFPSLELVLLRNGPSTPIHLRHLIHSAGQSRMGTAIPRSESPFSQCRTASSQYRILGTVWLVTHWGCQDREESLHRIWSDEGLRRVGWCDASQSHVGRLLCPPQVRHLALNDNNFTEYQCVNKNIMITFDWLLALYLFSFFCLLPLNLVPRPDGPHKAFHLAINGFPVDHSYLVLVASKLLELPVHRPVLIIGPAVLDHGICPLAQSDLEHRTDVTLFPLPDRLLPVKHLWGIGHLWVVITMLDSLFLLCLSLPVVVVFVVVLPIFLSSLILTSLLRHLFTRVV